MAEAGAVGALSAILFRQELIGRRVAERDVVVVEGQLHLVELFQAFFQESVSDAVEPNVF